jgi:class I lanthipeptide synthase
VLEGDRRAGTLAIAEEVARRCVDPARIAQALGAASRQTQFPQSLRWQPHSIADGDAGLAVLCAGADRCFPDDGWDRLGHGFLEAAAHGAQRADRLGLGLFGGTGGLAFAIDALSRDGTRYGRLESSVHAALAPEATRAAAHLRTAVEPVAVSVFDVISGLSGVAAVLLRRDPEGVLADVLSALVALAQPPSAGDLPRWFTPAELLVDESTARAYPHGHLNSGLAHGIPGPLAALSLALRDGHRVPGLAAAVRSLGEWLATHRTDDAYGVNWPSFVPVSADGVADASREQPGRSAWCYGSPGVAAALWLAGDALGDDALADLGVEAMLATLRRPVEQRFIDSPTFCHGVAGLLQIVLRFAHATGRDAFAEAAATLTDQLLAAYDPDRPLGYASLEPGANPVDRAGLLDGAPGVALVLLAAATDVEPTWDRLFLLT